MLRFSADNLLRCDMESMVSYLQHEGPLEWDKHSNIIFENAYSIKLNIKKMKKLEKEYMTIRSQEREEQIELRRLRTENGLLLQRLARLEEESEVMADHLVKCQLIRAQEAETTIALRCELSILRREYANLNSNSHSLPSEFMNNDDYLEDDSKHLTRNQNIENSIEANDVFSTYENTETSIVNTMPTTVSESTTSSVTTTTSPINKMSVSSLPSGNHINANGNTQIHHSHVVNGYSHNSPPPINHIHDNNSTITANTRNNHSSICSSPSEQQTNNSYDFCTLPRSRNREHHTRYLDQTDNKTDQLLSTTINQLQTDLVNSRFNEADAKKVAHELRCKLHELEESKSDQSLRYAEQIAVLKDELFGVKLRETELINQLEEFKRRFNDLDSLWQSHIGKCKNAANDTKRSSLWIGSLNSLDSHEMNGKIKFSDRLLETRFINQIGSLKQQITDLTVQQELSDRRADRLDKRVTELLESRTAFQARERELTLELKQLEQKCADIEAKRKADGVMWRSREMEFKTQLAERKQGYLQLEYQYESLLTSQSLQSKTDNHELMLRKSSVDSEAILENTTSNITKSTTDNNTSSNNNCFTLGSYLKFAQPNRQISLSNSKMSTPSVTTMIDTTTTTTSMKSDTYYPMKSNDNNELYSMWKDLPPAVMTESIGPLEDLCLIPDDPMITSIYLNSSSSETTTTTTSESSTPPPLVSNNQHHF
ncbi:Ecotropic viral integration site 5 protein [Schistosoma japonicum]|uniref:Ecotropic viral integration site 5 protein n=1 Tax=Schistosoma japonicum TaxID=6182 RepID=A0A4Z2D859_SCHJA|nr:Ecotropic viral integration site 5 protein [Schistosoma japonicum]